MSAGGAESIGLTGDRSLNYRLIFGIAAYRLDLLRWNFLRDVQQVPAVVLNFFGGKEASVPGFEDDAEHPATSLRI